jgi:hypothetical protein
VLRDEIFQVLQVGTDAVRLVAEFLERNAGPIDPKSRIAKGFGAGSIPGTEGRKEYFV